MGVKQVFDKHKADLTGMSNFSVPEHRLYISDVVQHALIEVDEKGTKVVAVTYLVTLCTY